MYLYCIFFENWNNGNNVYNTRGPEGWKDTNKNIQTRR